MGIMVVNRGDDPIVLVLRSDRGTLELTQKQCQAIVAQAGRHEVIIGAGLEPDAPRAPAGPLLQALRAGVPPDPCAGKSEEYRQGYDAGRNEEMRDYNQAVIAELGDLFDHSDGVLPNLQRLAQEHRKVVAALDAEGHDPRNGLVEQVKNLIDYTASVERERDAARVRADTHQLRVQLDAVITDTQPFLYAVAALLRNHPVLGDGTGVGQLANGAETASLWRELASAWRKLHETLGRPEVAKDRCDAPAGARTGG